MRRHAGLRRQPRPDPLLNDCVRVIDEAGGRPRSLDAAMANGAGWPMGPCALIDLIGIDVTCTPRGALREAPRAAWPPHRVSSRCRHRRSPGSEVRARVLRVRAEAAARSQPPAAYTFTHDLRRLTRRRSVPILRARSVSCSSSLAVLAIAVPLGTARRAPPARSRSRTGAGRSRSAGRHRDRPSRGGGGRGRRPVAARPVWSRG